jgi:hypothetical protein
MLAKAACNLEPRQDYLGPAVEEEDHLRSLPAVVELHTVPVEAVLAVHHPVSTNQHESRRHMLINRYA